MFDVIKNFIFNIAYILTTLVGFLFSCEGPLPPVKLTAPMSMEVMDRKYRTVFQGSVIRADPVVQRLSKILEDERLAWHRPYMAYPQGSIEIVSNNLKFVCHNNYMVIESGHRAYEKKIPNLLERLNYDACLKPDMADCIISRTSVHKSSE